ncbi:hypothetical protein [Candidatus Methylobacter favarea]|uniref:hypothetical protein n=1 Tax=Candidatus Methylobacter favarea TaxID=2707345 RepID=UPI00157D060B|nr:hypothetical protein [Candidatus Methylobacter favarea]
MALGKIPCNFEMTVIKEYKKFKYWMLEEAINSHKWQKDRLGRRVRFEELHEQKNHRRPEPKPPAYANNGFDMALLSFCRPLSRVAYSAGRQ